MASQSRIDLVHKAICAGALGNIEWSDPALRRFSDDSELQGYTAFGIRSVLRSFVNAGGIVTAYAKNTRITITRFGIERSFPFPNSPKAFSLNSS
jgi:hypothetical protein